MRRLHPVGLRERFVGRGRYAGAATEEWTLHRMDDAWFLRVDRAGSSSFTLYEALLEPDGRAVRLNEEQFAARGGRQRANHVLEGDVMRVTRGGGGDVEVQELLVPPGMLIVDWPLVLQGLVASFALRRGDEGVFDVRQAQPLPLRVLQRDQAQTRVLIGADELTLDENGIPLTMVSSDGSVMRREGAGLA